MRKFIFKIYVEGEGATEKDAFSDALQNGFSPGNRSYDDSVEICMNCNEEFKHCKCNGR